MSLHSLLDIASLPKAVFYDLLQSADKISKGFLPKLNSNKTVANLFYENSTRTLVSFELAAKRLGLECTNVDIEGSSEAKGEQFIDTLKTLAAMSIDAFVIRHQREGLILEAQKALPNCHFINAGDGMRAHPSQALLDALTIRQQFANTSKLSVAIVGDIRHSRVAQSLMLGLQYLGIKDIRLCAPSYFQPLTPFVGVTIEPLLPQALEGADVIYSLRVQKERFSKATDWSLDDYIHDYCLTHQRLNNVAKKPMIMHPGPMNRGIEITSDVADSNNSFILKQVKNGVFMRMAILDWVFRDIK